jgi:hypothetical protein
LRGNAMTLSGDTSLVPGQPVSPIAAAGHWVTANASVDTELWYPTGPLQLTAVDLPQRRLVDGMSMITAIDGAFVSLSDGLPGSASRLL